MSAGTLAPRWFIKRRAFSIVLAGIVIDRIVRQHYVLAIACLGQAVGYVLLAFVQSPSMAYVYSLVVGVSGGVFAISVSVLKPNLFGRQHLGGILGVLVAINVVASALGPIIFGAVFDVLNGYREIILVSALLPLTAGILSMYIRKPQLRGRRRLQHPMDPPCRRCVG